MPDPFFRNYVVSWTLTSPTTNLVEVDVIYDLSAEDNDISSFRFLMYDQDFGTFAQNNIDVFRNEEPFSNGSVDRSSDPQIFAVMNFNPPIFRGTTERIRFNFVIFGAVCQRDGKVGISGTWASSLNVNANLIEYDFLYDASKVGSNLTLDFIPSSDRAFGDFSSTDKQGFYVPYTHDELAFRTETPEEVFFSWDDGIFTGPTQKCPDPFAFTLSAAFVIGALVVVLASCAICAFFYGYVWRRVEAPGGRQTITHFFPNQQGRDIVLGPQVNANTTTVNAIYEEGAEGLDELVDNNTIEVNVEDHR